MQSIKFTSIQVRLITSFFSPQRLQNVILTIQAYLAIISYVLKIECFLLLKKIITDVHTSMKCYRSLYTLKKVKV